MKKKTYVSPIAKCIKIQTEGILAGSQQNYNKQNGFRKPGDDYDDYDISDEDDFIIY